MLTWMVEVIDENTDEVHNDNNKRNPASKTSSTFNQSSMYEHSKRLLLKSTYTKLQFKNQTFFLKAEPMCLFEHRMQLRHCIHY